MRFLFQLFFRVTFLPLVWLIYRVRRTGEGFVPREGGVLLLSNHVSYLDSFILYYSSPRPVRFVVLESYTTIPSIGWFLRLFKAIPIRPGRAKEAITRTVEALREGDVVCLFPEGGLTRLGVPVEFKKGFELIARKAEAPVVPVYIDGLWNSIFSFERGTYFRKRPLGWKCPLQVAFGRPIPHEEATAERLREAVLEQSVEALSVRREFELPLEQVLVRSLKRGRHKPMFIEYGKKRRRSWSRSQTLALSVAIARRWMNDPPDESERIGVLLPAGPMSAVVNFGLFLAGKTPVNLPFELDQAAIEEVAGAATPLGVRTIITSRAFMPQMMEFWGGEEGVFIDLQSMTSDVGVNVMERVRAFWEPARMTEWRLDLAKRSRDREAVGILSTPGGEPVTLSAEELHRNAVQATSAFFFRRDEVVCSEEGLSTPEGLQLACWAPVLSRGRVVSRGLPLRDSFADLDRAVSAEEVTVLAGRDGWYEKMPSTLHTASLRYGIIYGKLNRPAVRRWEDTLGIPLARAWSWHGRLVTMSRPDPVDPTRPHHAPQRGGDYASIGRPLPGIAVRVENDRILLRFDPTGGGIGDVEEPDWIEGPAKARMDPDGLLFLRDPSTR